MAHHIGECQEQIDLNEVETELQDIGLFDDIHAETRRTGETTASLDISVKEKWYYIPIPMIAYVDEFMGGLFFMDMNAFGVND